MYKYLIHIALFRQFRTKEIFLLVTVIIAGVIYFAYEAKFNSNVPPRCNSSDGYTIFKRVFEESPYARKNNLKVIDVEGWSTGGVNVRPVIKVCRVKLSLDDGTRKYYSFSFEARESKGYRTRMNPK